MAKVDKPTTELIREGVTSTAAKKAAKVNRRPQLAADIRALMSRYGEQEVLDSVSKFSQPKSGRKEEDDWSILSCVIKQDALDWLDYREPLKIRSNYSIATAFASAYPGQSAAATHRRIMGKLAKRRILLLQIKAWEIAEYCRPHKDYFRSAEALLFVASGRLRSTVQKSVSLSLSLIQQHHEEIGEVPPSTSISQIEKRLSDARIIASKSILELLAMQ